MEIPALIVNGFLESGKTRFLKELIEDNGFKEDGKTLILVCEEGEEEFDLEFCKKNDCSVRVIDNENGLDAKNIKKLIKEVHPATVVVEMNGMWNLADVTFPRFLAVQQQITIIDATTFEPYFANMRQKFNDMLKNSDVVIINRANEKSVGGYKRSLKLMAQGARFFMYGSQGEELHPADDLPYDITKEVMEIEDKDFGTWFIDTYDSPKRYEKRQVKVRGFVFKPDGIPPSTVVFARRAMTCCVNDIQIIGHLLSYNEEYPLKENEWIELLARVHYVQAPEGEDFRVVLEALDIKKIPEIDEPVLNLV